MDDLPIDFADEAPILAQAKDRAQQIVNEREQRRQQRQSPGRDRIYGARP